MLDVTLRTLDEKDQGAFAAWAYALNLFDQSKPWLVFSIDRRGEKIGGCYLCEIENGEAEIGVWIDPPHLWGKGYGAVAGMKLVTAAFGGLDLKRIRAKCLEGDEESIKPLKHAGFQETKTTEVKMAEGWTKRFVTLAISRENWKGVF